MAWSFNAHTPVYMQIAARLRSEIIRGVYKPNDQIPPVRTLAVIAAVNPNTVQRALALLEEEGILYSHTTQGRYVTDDEEILERARKQSANELIEDFLQKAKELSISREELISILKEANL